MRQVNRRRLWRALGAAAAASAAVVACNLDGTSFSSSPGFFPGSGGGLDSGVTQLPPPPCDRASEGNSCGATALSVCEKGTNGNAKCNTVLRCESGSRWDPDPKETCSDDCPPQYAKERPDGACEAPLAHNLICEYPDGTCGCAPASAVKDGGPDGDAGDGEADAEAPDADVPDAGKSDGGKDAGPYVWTCVAPAAGCPRTRPRLGSRCVKPMTCDYGRCVFDDGLSVRCSSGFWSEAATKPCP
jgi:hypothetical protein